MKKANLPTTENAVIIIFHFLADMISRILRFLFDKNPAIHRARRKRKLSKVQKEILVEQSDFYKQLNQRYQRFFEHRLSTFIQTYEFVGRNGYKVNEETKVLIGTSYITLTFGKRKFITDIFDKIVIYPDAGEIPGKQGFKVDPNCPEELRAFQGYPEMPSVLQGS